MKQFLKNLGVEKTGGMTRLCNTFSMLTNEEKEKAILEGMKRDKTKELTTKKIWLYLNDFVLDKENINRTEKVAVMGSNEATEANKKLEQLSRKIIDDNSIQKGLNLRASIFKFLIK